MSQSGVRFLTKYIPRLVLLDPGLHMIANWLLFAIQLSIILYIDASWKLRKRAVTEIGVLYYPDAFRIIVLVSYDEAGHMSRGVAATEEVIKFMQTTGDTLLSYQLPAASG